MAEILIGVRVYSNSMSLDWLVNVQYQYP